MKQQEHLKHNMGKNPCQNDPGKVLSPGQSTTPLLGLQTVGLSFQTSLHLSSQGWENHLTEAHLPGKVSQLHLLSK